MQSKHSAQPSRLAPRLVGSAILLMLLSACSDTPSRTYSDGAGETASNRTAVVTAGAPTSIVILAGAAQSTEAGQAFAIPLTVLVSDADGNPVSGAIVDFYSPPSNDLGAAVEPRVKTDSFGVAKTIATANGMLGMYWVNAKAPAIVPNMVVSFELTNTQGPPTLLTVLGGASQSARVESGFDDALRVAVTDAAGNAVAGVNVSFSVPLSGASAVLLSTDATSSNSGVAAVSASANSIAGAYTVSASIEGAAMPVEFDLVNLPDVAASITAGTGTTPQSQTLNSAYANSLSVIVRDHFDNAVPDVGVSYAAPDSGASADLSAQSAVTDAGGVAFVAATANEIAGGFTVTSSLTSGETAAFELTNLDRVPETIAVVSGTPQEAFVLEDFGAQLVVIVRDSDDTPLSDVEVTFIAPTTGASATTEQWALPTDSNGEAAISVIGNGFAGDYVVTATAEGVESPAVFDLTNKNVEKDEPDEAGEPDDTKPPAVTDGTGTTANSKDSSCAVGGGNWTIALLFAGLLLLRQRRRIARDLTVIMRTRAN